MNCVTCQLEYLMDKTAYLDSGFRRMHNVMDKGGLSAEVTDVQLANVKAIAEFEGKWNTAKCPHGGEKVHGAGAGADGGAAAATVAVVTPTPNIGMNALTSNRPVATNKPPQGNRAGRPVGSGSGSSSGPIGGGGGRGRK